MASYGSRLIDPPVQGHMAVPLLPEASEPVVVWRTWVLARDRTGPILRSVCGPSWSGPVQDARCLAGLHHRVVPDPNCSCGIYGRDDFLNGHAPVFVPRAVPIVAGFVELAGRIISNGPLHRASQARIIGPLTFSPIRPTRRAALARRFGRTERIRVVGLGDGYRAVWLAAGTRATPLGEWKADMGRALAERYRVGVEV